MSQPEYLVCLRCENPTYQFEYVDGKVRNALCQMCGADDPSDFAAPQS